MNDILNTRDIAILIWLVPFSIFLLTKSDVRKSVGSVIRAVFAIKIIVPFLITALLLVFLVIILFQIGYWKFYLLKDTIIWYFVFGISSISSSLSDHNYGTRYFRIIIDQIKLIVLFEYIMNAYTFSIFIELIIVPILFFVAILSVYSSHIDKYKPLSAMMVAIQGFIGLILLVSVVIKAFSYTDPLSPGVAWRSIALAPILCLIFIPWFLLLFLLSSYEQLFIRFRIGIKKDPQFIKSARTRLISYFGLRAQNIQDFIKANAWELTKVTSMSELNRLIDLDSHPLDREVPVE